MTIMKDQVSKMNTMQVIGDCDILDISSDRLERLRLSKPQSVRCVICGKQRDYVVIPDKVIKQSTFPLIPDTTIYKILDKMGADISKCPYILKPCTCQGYEQKFECFKYNKSDRLLVDSGINKRYRDKTFDNFIEDKNNSIVYVQCLEFAENIEKNISKGSWLKMVGNCGTGKTHLASAILRHCCEAGKTAKYITENKLYETIKNSYGNYKSSYVRREFEDCDLLVIDEIGASPRSPSDEREFNSVCLEKHNKQKSIIFISNLQREAFNKRLGSSIINRINEEPLIFNWESYRQKELNL